MMSNYLDQDNGTPFNIALEIVPMPDEVGTSMAAVVGSDEISLIRYLTTIKMTRHHKIKQRVNRQKIPTCYIDRCSVFKYIQI